MPSEVKLGIAALLPALLSALLYALDRKTAFGKINERAKQLIYGVSFGILAIVGTEWGIPMGGAQINCRDAAVLSAGLLFGAPAGIIAGVIGGVERWLSVYWGISEFTRVACTLSTIIAGIYAGLLRKFMFEDKKPGWLISFAIGVVMEVFHLTMVFITNMSTPNEAMTAVRAATIPMVVANGCSVMISALLISILARDFVRAKHSTARISQTIQRWLLVAVIFAFLATSYFVFALQNTLAVHEADSLLDSELDEVFADMNDEISFPMTPRERVEAVTKNRKTGETGYVVVLGEDQQVIHKPAEVSEELLRETLAALDFSGERETSRLKVGEQIVLCRGIVYDGFVIVSVLPEAEAYQERNIALYVNTFMEILVFAVLFGLIYLLIKRVVVDRLRRVNDSLAKITGGDLSETVNVRSNEEFASLSDDINSTVDTLKRYISEASARIDAELTLAKDIQASVLPNVFPAFPKRRDFDIFAMMDPAKEVGGDFYDFYMTEPDTLHFLVADVSGKGIGAAMFMMRAKAQLKTLTEAGLGLDEVFDKGNGELCEGNDAGMFVTAWQGDVDLSDGILRYVSAGHNPPLVRHADGQFEYLRGRTGFVLGGMEGVKYKAMEYQLAPGDIVLLYTDGVTEATDSDNRFYGEERLLEAVNSRPFDSMEDLCRFVKSSVDGFVNEAPQFDDITLLAFRYNGTPVIRFEKADISDISAITEFVEAELEKHDCPMKAITQISIAIDELYSNIVKYAYSGEKGPASVKVIVNEQPKTVYIRFEDEGIPYNPLTKEDPDITLSAEEREIGGLGIFVVKKTMDDMKYKYENGQNILTIKKNC